MLVAIPLVVGFIARNFAWLGLFTVMEHTLTSLFGRTIPVAYNSATVIVVMASAFVPLAFFIISNALRPLRYEQLEAAQLMGVPPVRLFSAVVLPITLRSATLAFLLILALAIAYFVTPRMIGGGKVDFIGSTAIKFLNTGDTVFANQLALTMLIPAILVSIVLVFLILRWRGRQLGF
jgi:ABC-type spermidine/putrescine transport system permease subunit I